MPLFLPQARIRGGPTMACSTGSRPPPRVLKLVRAAPCILKLIWAVCCLLILLHAIGLIISGRSSIAALARDDCGRGSYGRTCVGSFVRIGYGAG